MRYHPSMQRTFGAGLFFIVAAVVVSAGPKFISKWSAPEARGVTFAGKKARSS